MADTRDTERLIQEIRDKYDAETAEKLVSYVDMVLERNEHINLTAVRDRDEAMQKHLADSLSIVDVPEYIKAETVIDIGTGAGFPGALLAIADPDKSFVLLDSTLKRLKVIDEFAGELGISNICTLHARAEEISRKPEFNGQFDLCVSRAVAGLDKLAGWSLPFVKKGGYFIAYKGENYEAEITEASKSLKKYKGKIERVERIDKAEDISGHVLLVIKKQ